MTDNPRFALYKANYTVLPAYDMYNDRDMTCSVVGRCCDSGNIIQENVQLSSYIKRGDIIAVLTTGAYNYSMSSNYNKVAKLPIVMIKDGSDYLAVKRQTLEEMIQNEI
jgi:diaminopimelate decarboxylase